MYARITFVQLKPEDLDEATRLFHDSVLVEHGAEEGTAGGMLLTRENGEAMAIDFTDTLEHLQQNERNGFYQAQIAKFRDKIVGHPRREVFRVAVEHEALSREDGG